MESCSCFELKRPTLDVLGKHKDTEIWWKILFTKETSQNESVGWISWDRGRNNFLEDLVLFCCAWQCHTSGIILSVWHATAKVTLTSHQLLFVIRSLLYRENWSPLESLVIYSLSDWNRRQFNSSWFSVQELFALVSKMTSPGSGTTDMTRGRSDRARKTKAVKSSALQENLFDIH